MLIAIPWAAVALCEISQTGFLHVPWYMTAVTSGAGASRCSLRGEDPGHP